MGKKQESVLIFGTFDVGNYGDLLFPVIASHELIGRGFRTIHVSPTSRQTVFADAAAPTSIYDVPNGFRGVLIGGGNILSLNPGIYKNQNNINYYDLWIGAASIGLRFRVPVIFNSPGFSLPPPERVSRIMKFLIRATFKCAEVLKFRDSIHVLAEYSNRVQKATPDTVFGISDVWPNPKNRREHIALNLNQRHFPESREVARVINNSECFVGKIISFVIIGECHGDLMFTREVQKQLHKAVIWREIPLTLRAIAEEIATANLFIGSSMHGFISALSYETNAVLVNNHAKPLQKFNDLFVYAELDEKMMCQDFAKIDVSMRTSTTITSESLARIKEELLDHWEEIAKTLRQWSKPRKLNWVESLILRFYKPILKLDERKTRWFS